MRAITVREKLLSKYSSAASPKINLQTLSKVRITKTKGSTLDDLYREVAAQSALQSEEPYRNKNAQEIERIMMQNRKLIEQKRNSRR